MRDISPDDLSLEIDREYKRLKWLAFPDMREARKVTMSEYYYGNRPYLLKQKADYYRENADRICRQESDRRRRSRPRINLYIRNKRATDLNFKLSRVLRTYVSVHIRKGFKSAKSSELLGCSIESFRMYIESLFQPGMSWDNYGREGWHLDHIVAVALFDLTKPEHQRACFHFSNYQPLWWEDNYRKGKKLLVDTQLPLC